jgi:hypothetical protein
MDYSEIAPLLLGKRRSPNRTILTGAVGGSTTKDMSQHQRKAAAVGNRFTRHLRQIIRYYHHQVCMNVSTSPTGSFANP